MNIKLKLGLKIKELRKKRKISQEKFSEMIELNPRQVVRIENGESFPTADNLEKIAAALDVTVQDLFYNEAYIPDEMLKDKICAGLNNMGSRELRLIYTLVKDI